MTKIISLPAQKGVNELRSYAEELKNIDRLLVRHQEEEKIRLRKQSLARQKTPDWWNTWTRKFKR